MLGYDSARTVSSLGSNDGQGENILGKYNGNGE